MAPGTSKLWCRLRKWIFYLAALEDGEKVDLQRIQEQLQDKQGTRMEEETIHSALVKLARGDLLEYLELGGWFRTLRDPILVDFLRVWGRIEQEKGILYSENDLNALLDLAGLRRLPEI